MGAVLYEVLLRTLDALIPGTLKKTLPRPRSRHDDIISDVIFLWIFLWLVHRYLISTDKPFVGDKKPSGSEANACETNRKMY